MKPSIFRSAVAIVLAAAIASDALAAGFTPEPEAIRGHIGFLASDLLRGREPGTPGFDIAAAYVASRFTELGLKPGGDAGSYLQRVPLVGYRPAEQGEIKLSGAAGGPVDLVFGEDYRPAASPTVTEVDLKGAPMVFVGFGVSSPEKGHDDYAGLDVKGKIVVALAGARMDYPNLSQERNYYLSPRTKRQEAAKRGAIGFLTLNSPASERQVSFERANRTWQTWATSWRTPQGTGPAIGAGAVPMGTISVKGAAKLFAGSGHTPEEIYDAAVSAAANPPAFDLAVKADVRLKSETRTIESANVAGIIEGSDPKLRGEYVVMSAHLDHLGVAANPTGPDAIYNGALDNAAGIATLLEVARGFMQDKVKPKRSVIILAVTGEEKGELGSEYFAVNPTVPKTSIIADVNLDMPILKYDFKDVVAFGAERSTVGPAVGRAAARHGVKLSPDPVPEQGIFTRSDHYRFVEQGVPSVMLMLGFANGGEAAFKTFMAERYHKVGDDTSQMIDYQAAAKFAGVNYEIAKELANAKDRPKWNPGDFFGEKFGSGVVR
ncbi:M20/M25/M40 family metallo-hydrolase [soil metagenome]